VSCRNRDGCVLVISTGFEECICVSGGLFGDAAKGQVTAVVAALGGRKWLPRYYDIFAELSA